MWMDIESLIPHTDTPQRISQATSHGDQQYVTCFSSAVISVCWKQFELVAAEWKLACCFGVMTVADEWSFDAVF